MIEKLEFYHSAALVRLIEDPRCITVGKHPYGYCVNKDRIVAIKYSTKAHSPWGFSVSPEDIGRFNGAEEEFGKCVVALVCGGDGVCVLPQAVAVELLGNAPGWISVKRGFAGCYSLSGPIGTLRKKVAMNKWPSLVFDEEETT